MNDPIRDLYVGQHLTLRADGSWEFVERLRTSGCVVIFALTAKDELILVEQYRPAVRKRVIALPAGLAGDLVGAEKEGLAEAAGREFEEETGYHAASMHFMMEGPSSSGLTSEIMSFYRADGVTKVEGKEPDANEGITCHAVPTKNLLKWLRDREGEGFLVDYKIYAALYTANVVA